MNEFSLLPDDEPDSMPSERTMRREGEEPILGRIDQYALLRKLGGGGFGVVYLARDSASGVEVALKTLHPLLKHSAEEMDLLREKFALVSRLSHPNIATALVLHPCRDVDVWDESVRGEMKLSAGDSVMVMRYAPGATLSKWRRQFPGGIVPFGLAVEVGRQVAAALDYAHSERIVHRDIKPGNIMVETVVADGEGATRPSSAPALRVRILDFGLAAEIRSSMSRVSTEQGDTSGTRPYMAPEQWMGRKQDGRTDQYALACVLYELLSGAPPFAGVFETGDPVVMRTAVLSDAPEAIEALAPSANAALLRALAKEPKDRFPTCAALVEAIASAAALAEDAAEEDDGAAPRASAPRPEGAAKTRRAAVDGGARGPARRKAREEEPPEEEPPEEDPEDEAPEDDRPAGEALSVPFHGRTIVLRRCPAKGRRPAFWLAETPVAGWLWKAVTGSDPSRTKGDSLPATDVSWNDCNDFLERLNASEEIRSRGLRFRLPTAEEWRFACRAESCGDYCRLANGRIIVPRTLEEVAWYRRNSGGRKRPVGTKKPNAWGLRDMHGNVWEWTSTPVGGSRTLVGGSALEAAAECSASARSRRWAAPEQSFNDAGMRLLADCAGEKPSARGRGNGSRKRPPRAERDAEEAPPAAAPAGEREAERPPSAGTGPSPRQPVALTIKPVAPGPAAAPIVRADRPADLRRPGLLGRLRNLFGRS